MTRPTVVWTEVPVTDIERAAAFYKEVFGWTMTIDRDSGPDAMAVFNDDMVNLGGHLYEGKPAAGSTIHLALPGSLEEGIDRCKAAGGRVTSGPVPLPVGRFVYADDPDGNSIGLFEPKAA